MGASKLAHAMSAAWVRFNEPLQRHRPKMTRGLDSRGAAMHLYKKRTPFSGCPSIEVAMTYSPTNLCSTIGAVGLNFSVRNGKRWIPDAINRLNK